MNGCEEALERISAQLDGELSAGEQADLEAHLARCAECRALQADFQKLHASLSEAAAAWRAQPPDTLSRDVLEAVRASKVTPFQDQRRKWRRRSWASLAAVLALVLLGGGSLRLLYGGGNGAAAPPAAVAGAASGGEAGPTAADGYALRAPQDQAAPEAAPEDNAGGGSEGAIVTFRASSGAQDAVDLVYDTLGGDDAWTSEPLPNPELTGLLLVSAAQPAQPADPEAAGETVYASLVCIEGDGQAVDYLVHYHTYADATYAIERRYTLYEVYGVTPHVGVLFQETYDAGGGEAGLTVGELELLNAKYGLDAPAGEADPCDDILIMAAP